MDEIKQYMALWALFGYFIITAMKKPKNRIEAFYQLILGGPICWVIFIFCSVNILAKRL